MNTIFNILTKEAQNRMQNSGDGLHDLGHATRVALYSTQISEELHIDEESKTIVQLASWWHDTGRTITRKPSLVWMRCIDDFISAFLLWKAQKKISPKKNHIVSIATRIILCHNLGVERFLSKIILPKQYRRLISIVSDADTLDTLHITRMNELRTLVEGSRIYRHGYKIVIWWFLNTRELEFQTEWAKKYFVDQVLRDFLNWFQNTEVSEWHTQMFSTAWMEKTILQGEKFLQSFQISLHPR